ncbi:hypothetical protein AJ80_09241 [Polytolypa hystricis UAMH7299]|uniref:CREG-like beta-barrel domain-containing protein n=1 Tax=Polytolypa hystricis (strain UAMH7299) TaxID=1447883 RepID=A0A2B7WKV6_POLH7|nr:hypothetical protein AJ80_09241 [Polytolypa hystricis UAMH7299]
MRLSTFLPLLSLSGSALSYPSRAYSEKNGHGIDNTQAPIFIPDSPDALAIDNNDDPSLLGLPSWRTTHLLARRLLALSTTGVLSTVYAGPQPRHPSLAGVPIGLPDYIADCANSDPHLTTLIGPGNPLILALNIGTTFRNTKAGSNISLALDWWNQKQDAKVSLASLPRVSLLGTLERLPEDELDASTRLALEECFLKSHPDAKYWLPDDKGAAHSGYWARLVVQEALWIGGFGDRARIGWLDVEEWSAVREHGEDGEEGWADVRLPGECPRKL